MFTRGLLTVVLAATLFWALAVAIVVGLSAALPRAELAYVAFPTADAEIFVYDAASQRRHNLTRNPGYDLSPAWSPDGQRLAFVSDRDGGLHVFVMDANGRGVRRLTPPGRVYEGPRWSVSGEQIFFTARGATLPSVFAVNADGSDFQQISGETADPTGIMLDLGLDPSATGPGMLQAAAGRELSIDFMGGRDWGLYLSDRAGEPATLLASLGYLYGEGVTWSPDGQRLTFLSAMDGQVDLYLMPPTPGAQPLRLTHDRAYERSPVWRPLAPAS